jgi:type II secretory pathway pseudopilin PulG
MNNHKEKPQAFSVIELQVTLLIVGFLVALAVGALHTSRHDAQITRLEDTLARVREAKIHYYLDTKNPGEPPLDVLAGYANIQGGGEEIFYSKPLWEASHGADPHAGIFLKGTAFEKKAARIAPGNRETNPSVQTF